MIANKDLDPVIRDNLVLNRMVKDLRDENAALKARLAALEKAAQPVAKFRFDYRDDLSDDWRIGAQGKLTLGICRRIAACLRTEEGYAGG